MSGQTGSALFVVQKGLNYCRQGIIHDIIYETDTTQSRSIHTDKLCTFTSKYSKSSNFQFFE